MPQPNGARPYALEMGSVYEQAMKELARPFPSVKLPNWPGFNMLTGGFRVREYSILCGPTGCGKTTFLANISAQLLIQGVPHFVMSVETGHTDYMKRVISAIAKVDVNTGDPVPEEIAARIHQQYGDMFLSGKIQFSLYDNRVPVEQLKADLLWMLKHKGCKIAFIDNLNFFMDPTDDRNWNQEMDRVTHDLIMMTKQNDLHPVMVMHPKKTDGGRVLHEFDIKGSSTAVQEAHNIWLLNPPDADSLKNGDLRRSDRELTFKKMRRRGKYSGHKLVFECQEATYSEAKVCPP